MVCDKCSLKVCHTYCCGFEGFIPDEEWYCDDCEDSEDCEDY